MTVEETFKLFAGLRGLESKGIKTTVEDLIKIFNLNEFNNKLVQKLRLLKFSSKHSQNTMINCYLFIVVAIKEK